jgi:outer membrane protein TolC
LEGFVSTTARTLAAAGLVLAAAFPAAAQDTSIQHVRELIAQARAQAGAPQTPAPAQTPGSVFATPGPRVDLSIEDAVARAMERNIDISVARITPQLQDFTLAGLEANYRVNLTSTVSNNKTTDLPRVTTQGISSPTTSVREAWSAGVTQNIFRGGGNYSLSWTNSRFNSPSSVNIRNPQFQSGLVANFTQPLWRGRRIDNTRASLQTTRISQKNDQISLTSTTAATQANVRNAYWDLVYTIEAVAAAQNSYELADRLIKDNQARVEIGTLAPIDVVSAQAEAASRRNLLVTAQANVRTAELALKRLIVSGTEDPLWTSSINPVDRPSTAPEPIDVEGAVARALSERTDLQQSKNNLAISDINLKNQVDATKPQLNLTANYGLNGLGGPYLQRTGAVDPLTGGAVSSIIPSGYFDALRNITGFDAPTWTLGVAFAYPLGQSTQEATVARSKLSLEQTKVNLKALELQIATDVTNAAINVQSTLESVQSTAAARELAAKRLEAAQSKMEVGMATNYEVVQAQRDFVDSRNAELRAVLNYRKALVNFETVQHVGTRTVGAVGGGANGAGQAVGGGGQ